MRLFNKVLQLEDPKKAFNLPGCVSMKLKSGSDLSDKSLRASFQVCRVFYVEALQGGALSLDETVVNHSDVAVVLSPDSEDPNLPCFACFEEFMLPLVYLTSRRKPVERLTSECMEQSDSCPLVVVKTVIGGIGRTTGQQSNKNMTDGPIVYQGSGVLHDGLTADPAKVTKSAIRD
ncbi:hypothetical protein DY000_02055646 [Brassica cretica]|uniref:Uncharacterized protein n=1 Tax=Brassica cretica TaxID=69181 RepID=A0ABQ7AE78_BRACR|nr:hypothetical protein DY000_02055646 [Brassica cretica]